MSKRNKKIGQDGENLAQSVLNGLGIEMLEKIATPVLLSPHRTQSGKPTGAYFVTWGEKVSGDRMGILPNGIRVLTEVKTIWSGNLIYSELDDHQHYALKMNAYFHGLSLLVWVNSDGVSVMIYPKDGIAGFIPRKSITPDMAKELHVESIQKIQWLMKQKPIW